jgi:hypothetical protein
MFTFYCWLSMRGNSFLVCSALGLGISDNKIIPRKTE